MRSVRIRTSLGIIERPLSSTRIRTQLRTDSDVGHEAPCRSRRDPEYLECSSNRGGVVCHSTVAHLRSLNQTRGRDCKNVYIKTAEDGLCHAAEEHLGNPRASTCADHK